MKLFNPLQLAALSIAAIPMASHASDGLHIERQNPVNSFVRIEAPAHYILLPVQEDAPMSEVRVLADGDYATQLNVALADSRVDYFVPFDLSPYKGKKVLLDVKTHSGRNSVREASEAVWNRRIELSDTFDTTNRERFRPRFHHTPLYGWMNDPNGMFYRDGEWHLYYQYNPYGSKWENMSWGHSSSPDLISWKHHPLAIERTALGAVFSGSSAIDHNNTAGFGAGEVIAMFTAAGASQVQSLAHSNDNGETFTLYEGNPVINYERESRDPNFFWHEPTQQWVLTLASALDHEMLIFTSPDLKDWTLRSKFGKDYGSQAGVWECPDLMELTVEETGDKKWVLICNINPGGPFGGSATQYFVGDFDGTTFTCDDPAEVTKWMDYGKDHYATVSFSDAPEGRHTVIGWMSNWEYANDVPTMQYRSANTIARDLSLFKGADGTLYLASAPSPEYLGMRASKPSVKSSATVGAKGKAFHLPSANDGICEVVMSIDMSNAPTADITLSNAAGEKVAMTLDAGKDTFSMDRTQSGITDFSEHFPAVTVAPVHNDSKTYTLRLFIDRSSIEAFEGRGRMAMTNLVFPENPYTTLTVAAPEGKAKVKNIEIFPLNPAN